MNPVQSQTVIIQAPVQSTGPRRYEKLRHGPVKGLAVTQLVIGIVCIIAQSVLIGIHAADETKNRDSSYYYYSYYNYGVSYIASGIWSGIIFIITGAFGVTAARNKTLCPIVTFMVMSIIASMTVIPLLTITAIDLSQSVQGHYYYPPYDSADYRYRYNKDVAGIVVNSILVSLSVLEAVVAIVSAGYCCHGVCCCRQSTQGMVLSGPPVQGQTMVWQGNQWQPIATNQPSQGYQPNQMYPQATGYQPPPSYPYMQPETGGYPVQPGAPPAYNEKQQESNYM